jgi:hypothetical protein
MEPQPPPNPPLLILVRDLLFSSKITSAAKHAGTPFKVIRDPAQLLVQPGRRLLVDLTLDGAIPAAANWHQETDGDVVGFVGHVETEIIARAKTAGIPKVVSRGQFVQILPGLVE